MNKGEYEKIEIKSKEDSSHINEEINDAHYSKG